MNSHKTTTAMFSLIVAMMLVMTFAGLAAAGQESAANMTGLTWYDLNGNGLREETEPVAPNIPVYMRPLGGEAGIAGGLVTFSDANGVLDFGVMEFGDYQVQVDNGLPFIITLSETNSASTLEMPVPATSMPTLSNQIFLPLIVR